MYNEIEEKNADFIIANWSNADEDGTPWEKPKFDLEFFTRFSKASGESHFGMIKH